MKRRRATLLAAPLYPAAPRWVLHWNGFKKREKSRNQISRIWTGVREFCERTRLLPKSHARLATPKTPPRERHGPEN